LLLTLRNRFIWALKAQDGASAAVQSLLGRILTIGLSLINGMIVARSLGPVGRGDQAALIMWPQVVPAALAFGLPFGLLYHARNEPGERQKFYAVALLLALVLGALSVLIGAVGIPSWLHRYSPETILMSQRLMLFAPVFMLNAFMSSIFEAEHGFSQANILRYLPTALTTLSLIALILLHRLNPVSSAIFYLAPTAFAVLLLLPYLTKRLTFAWREIPSIVRLLSSYGLRVYGTNLLAIFSAQIDQVLVIGVLSSQDLGIYVVCLSAARVLNLFEVALSSVILPKTAGKAVTEVAIIVGRLSRLTLFLGLGSVLLLGSMLPWLLPTLYGQGFAAGVPTAEILLLEVILGSTTNVLLQTYLAVNRPGVVTLFQSVGYLSALPLMLLLMPHLRLEGAALALLIATCMRFAFARAGYGLVLKVPIPPLFLRKSDIAYVRSAVTQRLSAS
jgi:O-antigen/teichoic acid export membrane protein